MLLNKYSGISEILYIYLEKYKKYIAKLHQRNMVDSVLDIFTDTVGEELAKPEVWLKPANQ